jgi:hypothetical protein
MVVYLIRSTFGLVDCLGYDILSDRSYLGFG